jgi:hypothetical protein
MFAWHGNQIRCSLSEHTGQEVLREADQDWKRVGGVFWPAHVRYCVGRAFPLDHNKDEKFHGICLTFVSYICYKTLMGSLR